MLANDSPTINSLANVVNWGGAPPQSNMNKSRAAPLPPRLPYVLAGADLHLPSRYATVSGSTGLISSPSPRIPSSAPPYCVKPPDLRAKRRCLLRTTKSSVSRVGLVGWRVRLVHALGGADFCPSPVPRSPRPLSAEQSPLS